MLKAEKLPKSPWIRGEKEEIKLPPWVKGEENKPTARAGSTKRFRPGGPFPLTKRAFLEGLVSALEKNAGLPRALEESRGDIGGEYGKKRWVASAMGHMIPTMMRPPGPISQALLGLEQPSKKSVNRTIDQAKEIRGEARELADKASRGNWFKNKLESGQHATVKGIFHEPRGPVREALGRVVREVQGKARTIGRVIKNPRAAAKGTWTGIKGNLQKVLPGVFGKRAFIEGFLDELDKCASDDAIADIFGTIKKHIDAAGGLPGVMQKIEGGIRKIGPKLPGAAKRVEEGIRKVGPKLKPGADVAASGIEAARKIGADVWKFMKKSK